MTDIDARLPNLDGFAWRSMRAARATSSWTAALQRHQLPQRDQIRRVFEALEEDDRVRVIVPVPLASISLRRYIKDSSRRRPSMFPSSPETSGPGALQQAVIAAIAAIVSASGSRSARLRFPMTSETTSTRCRNRSWARFPVRGSRAAEDHRITRTKDIVMRSKRFRAAGHDWGIATESSRTAA